MVTRALCKIMKDKGKWTKEVCEDCRRIRKCKLRPMNAKEELLEETSRRGVD